MVWKGKVTDLLSVVLPILMVIYFVIAVMAHFPKEIVCIIFTTLVIVWFMVRIYICESKEGVCDEDYGHYRKYVEGDG